MKIGIESQRLFRASKHGMDVVALELLRELQMRDDQNEYTVLARNGPDTDCLNETKNFHKQILSGLTYADWEQLSLPAALKRSDLDLLHCTANTAPMICRVPLVLTLHDIIYLQEAGLRGSAYQNAGNLYRRLVVPRAIKQAKMIITVSNYEKKIILDHCRIDPDRVVVIYNGVSKRFHAGFSGEQKQIFRQESGLPKEFILFLGNTAPKKNTEGLIKAFIHYCELLADPLPLVITDYEKKSVLAILKEQGKQGLMKRIFCPGYIPSAEMPRLYSCCSLFVYPSLRESFGLPVLEAMACGVPVICSSGSAIPEIAGDAALLVDPRDPHSIAQAIIRVTGDSALRSSLAQKGLTRASQFSWSTASQQVLGVYDRVFSLV